MDDVELLSFLDRYRNLVERGVYAAADALDKEGAEQFDLWQVSIEENQQTPRLGSTIPIDGTSCGIEIFDSQKTTVFQCSGWSIDD